ncbi:LAME_0E01332g1_1 [Lachancea meyersii CBS 8951]|uniref:MICOS complex subunit n=1 Tax=Lachancea meyersii CBS 8951 TaxID=1266667 RepID=A0A1G4JF12_9SACH|nr:LAME_0E01332g1_1 [Lachancea meyersii CBS 8951]
MAPNFYRPVDFVGETVIPPETGSVLSSSAKEAAPSHDGKNSLSHRAAEVIGDNQLLDGISLRSPTYLTTFFNSWRTRLSSTVNAVNTTIDEKSRKYYNHEKRLTSTIANLHSDPREELVPGFTYTLVAAMSGSVLTRNKNILARITAPLVLGTLCYSYVLPKTASNTFDLLFDLEKQAFPAAAQGQLALYTNCKNGLQKTVTFTENASKFVSGTVSKTTHLIKEWTGLNV